MIDTHNAWAACDFSVKPNHPYPYWRPLTKRFVGTMKSEHFGLSNGWSFDGWANGNDIVNMTKVAVVAPDYNIEVL